MIRLEVFGESEAMAVVARLLDKSDDVSRVRLTSATRPGHAVVLASVRPRAVDELLGDLRQLGVPDAEVTLTREDVLGRSSGEGAEAGLVWEDVLGMAARNSRPIARYLAFMFVAGVIACHCRVELEARRSRYQRAKRTARKPPAPFDDRRVGPVSDRVTRSQRAHPRPAVAGERVDDEDVDGEHGQGPPGVRGDEHELSDGVQAGGGDREPARDLVPG